MSDTHVIPLPRTEAPITASVKFPPLRCLGLLAAILWLAIGVAGFHIAYFFPRFNALILLYVIALANFGRVSTGRQAAYLGFFTGFLVAAPQLSCFWVIFGPTAISLWCVIGFWIGVFVFLARSSLVHFGPRGALLFPVLWTGLEYFRSELYYLKFSWMNVGYSLAESPFRPMLHFTGMYGAGFLAMTVAALLLLLTPRRSILASFAVLVAAIGISFLPSSSESPPSVSSARPVTVSGVQLEFPSETEVVDALDKLLASVPETELFFLSEYTFVNDSIPAPVLDWCRRNHHYLLVGGKDAAPPSNFHDTAFVVGPSGDIVFRQGKSVPIQFMKDGLPAKSLALWDSPWGKIGICICYDLSYTRVTDRLVKLGAQALFVPTMDVVDWGRHEHELHAHVAPIRAAEYGIPVLRVASSGISQFTDRAGRTIASAGVPGQGEHITGKIILAAPGSWPLDRWLAPVASAATGLFILWLASSRLKQTRIRAIRS